MNNFWGECFWWRQLLQNLFSSDASSFLLVDSIALICSFRTLFNLDTEIFCLWSCTHEQIFSISNWQFLIPCYHQNLKGNVKHILFQQAIGLLHVMRWAKDLNLVNMNFETDSKVVAESIYKGDAVLDFMAIIHDCRHLLMTDLATLMWSSLGDKPIVLPII